MEDPSRKSCPLLLLRNSGPPIRRNGGGRFAFAPTKLPNRAIELSGDPLDDGLTEVSTDVSTAEPGLFTGDLRPNVFTRIFGDGEFMKIDDREGLIAEPGMLLMTDDPSLLVEFDDVDRIVTGLEL